MAATDVKLLQETSKNILKAAESKEPASTIITMLASLDSFKATEDLLRQSKIGVAVTKLRQHQDKKVAEAAGRLVNRWKQEVNQHKKKRPTEGSPVPANKALNVTGALNGHGSATQSPASQSTPSAIKKESTGRKSTVAPEKRNTNTDAVEYKLTNDPTRDGCLKLMYDGIAFMSNETPDDVLDIARKVELAAFEHFNETNGEYKSKIRSLYQNLKMKGNSTLRENVYSGKIPPKNFVSMSSDELKSEEKRAEDAVIEKENMSKAMTAVEEKAISTTLTCGKCKQNQVAYVQAQTRSADEPLTTFCDCQNCGHKWKFS